MSASPAPRRQAGLLQERSRKTRRKLVRTALLLWTERGFETGIEDTTVEEIVQAAGVTKGTFYFHFRHKEDILLEMGYQTAQLVHDETERCLRTGKDFEDSFRIVMNAVARNIKKSPRAAVGRAVVQFQRPTPGVEAETRIRYGDAFSLILAKGQQEGRVTDRVEVAEISAILEILVLDTLLAWSQGKIEDIRATLHRRTAIVLLGVRPGHDLRLSG